MDNGTFVATYIVLVQVGFWLTAALLIFYTAIAPWYKYAAGRYIWGLLLAIFFVLSVSMVRLVFGEFPFRRELALGTFGGFLVAELLVGIGIYRAQIKHYHKNKFIKEFKESHREQ